MASTRKTSTAGATGTTKAKRTSGRGSSAAPRKSGATKAAQAGPGDPGALKAASPAAPARLSVVSDRDVAAAEAGQLKKPELIEAVVARSNVRKKFAKPVIEAMMEVLGEAIAQERELNLEPLGKVKYNRAKEDEKARVLHTRIRQNKPAAPARESGKETLAERDEES